MGHDEGGRIGEDAAQGRLDQGLRVHVQGRQGVVQDEEAGSADDGPGQGEALALAAGEAEALLADLRVRVLGERVDEVRLRDGQGAVQLGLTGVGLGAHEDVLPHARGEEGRFLEGDRHECAERFPGHLGDVLAVQGDPARCDLVQPGDQRGERRLPGAGPADESHGLAGADVEVDAVEYGSGAGRGVRVAEPDGVETESAGGEVGAGGRAGACG